MLAPLPKLMSINRKFKWKKVKQDAFFKIKQIVTRNTLLTYPDFNKTFKVHTDASNFRLGSVIRHKFKPIALYSRKITGSQQQHTVTERELISTVEILNKFRNILLGQNLRIHTDNRNLTCKDFYSNIVWRWRLILKNYFPDI